MNTLSEIQNALHEQQHVLINTYHVKALGVFGSAARGEMTPESDIDILVEFSKPVGFFTFLDLEARLEQLLGRKVDLVTKNALKPILKERVMHDLVYVAT